MKNNCLFVTLVLISFPITSALAIHKIMGPDTNKAVNYHETVSFEGEALAEVIAIDKFEINAANIALKESLSPKVKQYAEHLKKDHKKNLQDMLNLSKQVDIKPVGSVKLNALQKSGDKTLKQLKSIHNPREFEKTYLNQMVKGHGEAIQLLDKAISKVKSSAVKQALESTRQTVEEHLKIGKSLQN